MNKNWIRVAIAVAILAVTAFVIYSKDTEVVVLPGLEPQACNMDGKVCPDGSVVGRTGPQCEFAECPPANATTTTITTYLGGEATGLNVTVNPREIVSDSRCPVGVQCIWAGEVTVRTALSTQVSHGEHVLKLGEPQIFGDFDVTLINVTPAAVAGQEIPVSSYRFTFEVKKRQ